MGLAVGRLQPLCVPATSLDGFGGWWYLSMDPKANGKAWLRPLCRSWIALGAAPKPECIPLSQLIISMDLRAFQTPLTAEDQQALFTGRACSQALLYLNT